MKNILFAVLVFSAACTQNSKTETASSSTDSIVSTSPVAEKPGDTIIKSASKVEQIRAKVQDINNQKLLVQNFNWANPNCADQGTIRYFLDGDEIVKVIETGFIGDGGWTKEYYYADGKFIFSFDQYIGGPAGMPLDTNEVRIYMDADTLVLQRKNSDNVPGASKKLTARSREYRILKALETKDFGNVLCN